MASGRNQRIPIRRDAGSYSDRSYGDHQSGSGSVFDDLRRQMDDGWGSDSFSSRSRLGARDPFSSSLGGISLGDEVDRLCKDFFQLKPRNPRFGNLQRDDRGSCESLDDDKVFTEGPHGSGRHFQMSFDVRDYEPHHLSIKVDRDTLQVEAKREVDKDGMKSTKQFSRNIHIPKEVDPEKLTSSLSSDGILTIEAPAPPEYKSLSQGAPQSQPHYTTASEPKHSYVKVQGIPIAFGSHGVYNQDPASQVPAMNCHGGAPYQSTVHTTMSGAPPHTQPPSYPADPNSPHVYGNYAQPSPPPAYPHPQPHYPTSPPAYPPQSSPVYQSPPPQPAYPAPPPPIPLAKNTPPPEPKPTIPSIPLETPVFSDTEDGRRMDLIVELGKPYTPEDILVKLEGRQLQVEAEHVEKIGGKKSKSCMSREFDLDEDIDPRSVQANFDEDGRLIVVAIVVQRSEAEDDSSAEPVTEL